MWIYSDSLSHHGIKGQKWGVRRFQNSDGTLTAEGRNRLVQKRHRIESKRNSRAITAAVAGIAVNQTAKQVSKAISKNVRSHKTFTKVVPRSLVEGAVGSLRQVKLRPKALDMIDGVKIGVKDFVSNPLVQTMASTGIRYVAKSGLMSFGMAAIPASLVVTGSMVAANMITSALRNDIRLRQELNEEHQTQEKYKIKDKE